MATIARIKVIFMSIFKQYNRKLKTNKHPELRFVSLFGDALPIMHLEI